LAFCRRRRALKAAHRLYAYCNLKRLVFIRRSQEPGFTSRRNPQAAGLVEGGDTYGEVQQAVGDHLKVIRPNITDLLRMERTLAETAARGKAVQPRLSNYLYFRA